MDVDEETEENGKEDVLERSKRAKRPEQLSSSSDAKGDDGFAAFDFTHPRFAAEIVKNMRGSDHMHEFTKTRSFDSA